MVAGPGLAYMWSRWNGTIVGKPLAKPDVESWGVEGGRGASDDGCPGRAGGLSMGRSGWTSWLWGNLRLVCRRSDYSVQ